MFLFIIRTNKVYIPNIQEIMENELLKDEIQDMISSCEKQGDGEKQLKKLCNKYKLDYIEEQIFVNDNKNNKEMMEKACLVIDIIGKKIIKSRISDKEENEKLMNEYLEKYSDSIKQVKKQIIDEK